MAASMRSLPEEIPRIPTGKPGSIANRIFSKVSRSNRSRNRLNSTSTQNTDYYDRSQESPQPFSHQRRKDLKGRILEIFEENENEYIRGNKLDDEKRDLTSHSETHDFTNNFSNLEKQEEIEQDKQKIAKRSLELKSKMKDYINQEGKFKSMDVRTPVLDEKYTGRSVGKRRPSQGDIMPDNDRDWVTNKYQEFHRSPSLKNSMLSHPSEAWSPSPANSPDVLYKQRAQLQSKTYTKTLNKVLSSNLRSGNMKEEDGSERRRLYLMIWGCIICASCVILVACILGLVFAFMNTDSRYHVR